MTILICGSKMTNSGYPRLVKEWQRGAPMAAAKTVFKGKSEDVNVTALVVHDHGRIHEIISRSLTFFTSEIWLRLALRGAQAEPPG